MKILVIGDSCIDRFVYGKAERLTPEAPVPVLDIESEKENHGMAGNVFHNLINLGSNVDIITNETKPIKTRWIDKESNQMILRTDEAKLFGCLSSDVMTEEHDAVIISDYNKGFLSSEDVCKIVSSHPRTFLDTKRDITEEMLGARFIKINEKEHEQNKDILSKYDGHLIVTLGKNGAKWNGEIIPTKEAPVFDLTGAGDVFLSALVYNYLNFNDVRQAIEFANHCASISVRKRGTGLITKEDLE